MSLIHNAKYFTKEEILESARNYEFPNPLAVEIFLWDCELAAQLQDKCADIAQTKIPYFREMKGKALDRVFWQIVTLENLQDVESIV